MSGLIRKFVALNNNLFLFSEIQVVIEKFWPSKTKFLIRKLIWIINIFKRNIFISRILIVQRWYVDVKMFFTLLYMWDGRCTSLKQRCYYVSRKSWNFIYTTRECKRQEEINALKIHREYRKLALGITDPEKTSSRWLKHENNTNEEKPLESGKETKKFLAEIGIWKMKSLYIARKLDNVVKVY